LIKDGRVLECNRFLSEKSGYAAEEVVGSLFSSFFDTESIVRVESALSGSDSPEAGPTEFSARLVCKNGDSLEVRIKSEPCLAAGKPARLVVLRDSGGPTPAAEWSLDWPDDFFPEELPAPTPEYSRC
jgi:PAS domain S-box-containing protein